MSIETYKVVSAEVTFLTVWQWDCMALKQPVYFSLVELIYWTSLDFKKLMIERLSGLLENYLFVKTHLWLFVHIY